MSVPDDLEASLPQPPPPAPARRDAAIRLALDRFDGKDAPPPAAPELRAAPWWTRISRPQLGAFATLMLVAAIGIPIAWNSLDRFAAEQSDRIAATDAAARRDQVPTTDTAARREAPPTNALEPAQTEGPAVDLPPAARPTAGDETAALPPPPPEAPQADTAQPMEPAPVIAAKRFEPAQRSAAPAPPPPAIPAPMMADAAGAAQEAYAEEDSIVVTSARARNAKASMRGDWNACTVNDPQQSLRGCGGLIRGEAAENIESGLAHAWKGDTEAAIAQFDRAIAAAPRNAFAWLNRGLAHQREGDLDRALADLDQAIRLDPDSARAYYSRSIILRQQGDPRRATRDAQRAIDIDPKYKEVAR